MPKLGDPNTQKLITENNSSEFEQQIRDLESNEKYFYRSYATNAVGTSYGSVESFKTLRKEEITGPEWIDAQPAKENNWWISPWFGSFYAPDNRGWLMHAELGWLFAYGQPNRAVWLWQSDLGWVWTHPEHYPFMYSNQLGNWIFFHGQLKEDYFFTITGRIAG